MWSSLKFSFSFCYRELGRGWSACDHLLSKVSFDRLFQGVEIYLLLDQDGWRVRGSTDVRENVAVIAVLTPSHQHQPPRPLWLEEE